MSAPATGATTADSQQIHGSTATLAVSKPTSTASGDRLIAVCTSDQAGASATADYSCPQFTNALYAALRSDVGTAAGASQRAFDRVAGGSEPATYTFTRTGGSGNWGVMLLRISHASGTPVIDVVATSFSGADQANTPGLTTSVNDCLLLRTTSYDQGKTLTSVPTGTTLVQHNINSSNDGAAAQETVATAGVQAAKSYVLSSNTQTANSTISIKPPSSPPPSSNSNFLALF